MLNFLEKRAKHFGAKGLTRAHQTIIEAANLPKQDATDLIQTAELAHTNSILEMLTTIAIRGSNGYATLLDLYKSRH